MRQTQRKKRKSANPEFEVVTSKPQMLYADLPHRLPWGSLRDREMPTSAAAMGGRHSLGGGRGGWEGNIPRRESSAMTAEEEAAGIEFRQKSALW